MKKTLCPCFLSGHAEIRVLYLDQSYLPNCTVSVSLRSLLRERLTSLGMDVDSSLLNLRLSVHLQRDMYPLLDLERASAERGFDSRTFGLPALPFRHLLLLQVD